MSAHPPGASQPSPSSLPPSPWVLIDTTTLEQLATALTRLEAWLLSGELDAATQCAHALSHGEDDPDGVAGWVGTLAEHLHQRAQEASTWS